MYSVSVVQKKKWSWPVLIGNCSKSQPLNFDRLDTNKPANTLAISLDKFLATKDRPFTGKTSAKWPQKFHIDDMNQCLHN